jgi:Ca2+-binding RTX toxin-like protein
VSANLALGSVVAGADTDTLSSVEGITGSAFDDAITGDAGANVLSGGLGNDTLIGGLGNDTLTGGAGIDTVDYATATSGVSANLAAGSATIGVDTDTLSTIENVIGSANADVLVGSAGSNRLIGGLGDDMIDGSFGVDSTSYASAGSSVAVNLALGGAVGGGGNDTLISIEDVEGSAFDDSFIGSAGSNHITGGDGNDYIDGGAGDDVLDGGAGSDTVSFVSSSDAVSVNLTLGQAIGGAGADTLNSIENVTGSGFDDVIVGDSGLNILSGGLGNDRISGGSGNDVIDGGDGSDTVDYAGAGSAVSVNLQTGAVSGATTDTLTSIENITGSGFDDSFVGTASDNIIDGGAGVDTVSYAAEAGGVSVNLSTGAVSTQSGFDILTSIENVTGGLGDDAFVGTSSDNVIDGGSGLDSVSYESATGGVNVNLDTGVVTGAAGADTLTSIEDVTGSGFDDTLNGTAASNMILAGAGADAIVSGGGDDVIDGGVGTDTLSYASLIASVSVNLQTGVVTGATQDTLSNVENITGTGFDDAFVTNAASNFIDGGAGSDTVDYSSTVGDMSVDLSSGLVLGGGGADILLSVENLLTGSGDDVVSASSSDNVIDGGAGLDKVSYSSASGAVNINLDTGVVAGASGADTLISVEGVMGSGFDDIIVSGADGNFIDGGAGDDLVDYSTSTSGVAVNLSLASNSGGAAGDVLLNIEGITGSDYADTITGDDGANTLIGGLGDDTIDGGNGIDVLDGADGFDTLDYGNSTYAVQVDLTAGTSVSVVGNDTISGFESVLGSVGNDDMFGDGLSNVLIGGLGNDLLDGRGGVDSTDYTDSASGVNVNLLTGVATGGAGTDTLVSIENVTGSSHRDTLTGDAADNVLMGGADIDTLAGGLGNDTLDGGDGDDLVSYASATGGVTVDLGVGAVSGAAGNDVLISIEHVQGSAYADTLAGDAGYNRIYGGGGVDTVDYTNANGSVTVDLLSGAASGGGGDDALFSVENVIGTDFADTFISGLGANRIEAGLGTDRVDYTDAAAAVQVDLQTGSVTGGSGRDVLVSIEDATGSGFDDTLTGSSAVNSLIAGEGADTLDGGAGSDTLNGGLGVDTASYKRATAAVVANLGTGSAVTGVDTDTLVSIENVVGSNFADDLTGDALANTIDGGVGNDRIDGAGGTDTVSYATASTSVTVDLGLGTANGGAGADTLISIENATGGMVDDVLVGSAGVNTLDGGAGNDTLIGGLGDDTLNGGSGLDTASYAASTGGVKVNLTTGVVTGGDGADTLISIENVTGSALNDQFTDSSGNNVIHGGAGNDTISYAGAVGPVQVDLAGGRVLGGSGYDILSGIENVIATSFNDVIIGTAEANIINGGAGVDMVSYEAATSAVSVNLMVGTVTGGAGADRLIAIESAMGSVYDDTFIGSAAANRIDGSAGMDTVDYGLATSAVAVNIDSGVVTGGAGLDRLIGIENINASGFDDTVVGNALNNRIFGRDGLDKIYGAAGDDYLVGDAGNDILYGGDGVDSLLGGLGDDKLYGDAGNDTLIGADGRDVITGGLGDDKIYGDAGNDTISAGDGHDVVSGGLGDDVILGDAGNDSINGGMGYDTIRGGDGNDVIAGAEDYDTVYGGLGNDIISGDDGNDTLYGEAGADTLIGGTGTDIMTGGSESDVFKFLSVSDVSLVQSDTIRDFVSGVDKLDLSGMDAKSATLANDAFKLVSASSLTIYTAEGAVWLTGGVLYGSTDQDVAAEFSITMTGVLKLAPTDVIL